MKKVAEKKLTPAELALQEQKAAEMRVRRNAMRIKRRTVMQTRKQQQAEAERLRKAKREQATRERVARQGEERKRRESMRLAARLMKLEQEQKNRALPEVKTLA